MLVFFVHPVAVLNAAFCIFWVGPYDCLIGSRLFCSLLRMQEVHTWMKSIRGVDGTTAL